MPKPKTKAELEKALAAVEGKLSRCTRKVAALQGELDAGGEGHAGLRRELAEAKDRASAAEAAAQQAKAAAVVANDGRVVAENKLLLAQKAANKARSMCGLVVTRVEDSAWAHKAEQVGLDAQFLAALKDFAENG